MESLAEDLATMVRRPPTDAHVAAIRKIGYEKLIPQGAIFPRTGDPAGTFRACLS